MSDINYRTVNIKDLFNELMETKGVLFDWLRKLEKIHKETEVKTKGDGEAEILLRSYYDDDLYVTRIDAIDILKVIDNLLNDKIIREGHIKQLKNIANNNTRQKRLGDFKEDWLHRVKGQHKQDYEDLYINFREMEKWIDDCNAIGYRLEDYIGEMNPMINQTLSKEITKIKHKCEITKDNQVFIDDDFSEITLTNSLCRILEILIKLDKNKNYPLITTKYFMARFGDDAFRTSLKRLRKETSNLFSIKNTKNAKGEGCYYLEFDD